VAESGRAERCRFAPLNGRNGLPCHDARMHGAPFNWAGSDPRCQGPGARHGQPKAQAIRFLRKSKSLILSRRIRLTRRPSNLPSLHAPVNYQSEPRRAPSTTHTCHAVILTRRRKNRFGQPIVGPGARSVHRLRIGR
jgi:hypothetical protein